MSQISEKEKKELKKSSKTSKKEKSNDTDSPMIDISNKNNKNNNKKSKDKDKSKKKDNKSNKKKDNNKNDKNNNNNDKNNNNNDNNNDDDNNSDDKDTNKDEQKESNIKKLNNNGVNKISKQKKDAYGKILLAKQLKELQKSSDGFSVGLKDDDNLYEWELIVEGPTDTLYEGGYFSATLSFPQDFPSKPPKMVFTTPGFWHPNVYKDGKVCISILHEAKEDPMNLQESIDEKWRPILSVEAVIISVLSMLSEPNFSSPANIDASVEWKKTPEKYKKRIRKLVRKSQEIMMGG